VAAPLKRFFDRPLVERIAGGIAAAHPAFPRDAFVRDAARGLERLELLDRGRHIAAALRRHLPPDAGEAIGILVASLGPEIPGDTIDRQGMAPFLYLPHVIFVAEHGRGHFEASMRAQHELTRRFSAEFSIRAFLAAEPARTLGRLRLWTRDPSPHVRRLVSEGTRPRLPWAPRLRAFQADPGPVLALLERLRDDPALYVRRSVANNLNDVSKDHPGLVIETCTRWLADASPERRWIVKHALRTLVRRGDLRALALLGHGERPRVRIHAPRLVPRRVRIGGEVAFAATLASRTRAPQRLVVDLAVHYVKADGAARPKVFKLRVLELPAGGSAELSKRLSLRQMSTRRHHAGVHAVELRVNGVAFPAGRFEVVGRRPGRASRRGRGEGRARP
jgi:3-methyladenine DNA glycosylase AlkC